MADVVGPRQTSVDTFRTVALQLISEAAAYAAGGQYNPDADANIRELRVLSAGLNSALGSIMLMPATTLPPTPGAPAQAPATPAARRA